MNFLAVPLKVAVAAMNMVCNYFALNMICLFVQYIRVACLVGPLVRVLVTNSSCVILPPFRFIKRHGLPCNGSTQNLV